MADDFRPHLLITEDDVEAIENKKHSVLQAPTGV